MRTFPQTRRPALRLLGMLVLSVVLLMDMGPWETQRARANPARTQVPITRVNGTTIDPEGDLRTQAALIGRSWLGEEILLVAPGQRKRHSRRALGARVDMERLLALLEGARSRKSALLRVHAQERPGQALEIPIPVTFDGGHLLDMLVQVKDEIDRAPREARIDTETHELQSHVDGLLTDVWASLDRIEVAIRQNRTSVDLATEVIPATRSADRLAQVSMAAVLGQFETRYDASFRSADRSFNLAVAASKIDGQVLMPGEVFDFNATVGERSEANGFRVAPVIAAGELVDGIGGGTCQISGTLHGAAFFAALPVVERRPHSRPSGYIKLGLDAAVSYPSMNLKFRNDRDFPLVIGLKVEGGIVRATLWGAEHHSMVSFVRRVDETTAFDERTVQDPSLPVGTRVLSQRGVPGFKLTRWRVIRHVATNQAVRETMEDAYPPTTQIWRVGTGGHAPAGFVAPAGDAHLEYRADEYLSLTKGAGIDGELEVRRPGRTGNPGWMARMGYASADH